MKTNYYIAVISLNALFFLTLCGPVMSQKNMTLRSQVTLSQMSTTALSNIWGYTDSLGNEYALVGTETGVSIVDVTNPSNPQVLFNVPGPNTSIWREIATYGKFAFVGSDQNGPGLRIIDLSNLPASYNVKTWNGDSTVNGQIFDIHTLRVDGNFLYIFGGTFSYPLFIDISDPWNPHYKGRFIYPGGGNTPYVHDGYVRNDTGYFSHIYVGFYSVVDVTDKTNPVLLATQNTPGNFTHNDWLSDDGKTLFTTDEVDYSYLTAYDISNLSDIKETDRLQFNTSGSVVHNTHVLNDFCVTSWYKDGVVIVDGHRPSNLIVVGYYDTSPLSGTGMDGDWGVYPYFPSGTIIASDMNEGMFVLTPDYKRACYLEGNITDSACGLTLNNVLIEILDTQIISTSTGLNGDYRTGTSDSGVYSVRISKPGYVTKVFNGISLVNGNVTVLNAQLANSSTLAINGTVIRTDNSIFIAGAMVEMKSNSDVYSFITDSSGSFSKCNTVADTFEITIGKWGFNTICFTQIIDSSAASLNFSLAPGYYDDFSFDFGWYVTGTSATGQWERGEPAGTWYIGDIDNNSTDDTIPGNPEEDITGDCLDKAFVTGNGGGYVADDDVDNGNTILSSPVFDLSGYTNPFLAYYRWFFNDGGFSTPNDSLTISLTNGSTSAVLETVTRNLTDNFQWFFKSFKISDLITPSATMQLIIRTADASPGNLVEAAFDQFVVYDSTNVPVNLMEPGLNVEIYPNPSNGKLQFAIYNLQFENTELKIYNPYGQEVTDLKIQNPKSLILNLNLPGGIYFYKIINKDELFESGKIIIL